MSILRGQDADGTKYFVEPNGKITVKNSQDVNPILEKNKRLYPLMMDIVLVKTLNV